MELTKEQIRERLLTWLGDGTTEESLTRNLLLLGAIEELDLVTTGVNSNGEDCFTFAPSEPVTAEDLAAGSAIVSRIEGALFRVEKAGEKEAVLGTTPETPLLASQLQQVQSESEFSRFVSGLLSEHTTVATGAAVTVLTKAQPPLPGCRCAHPVAKQEESEEDFRARIEETTDQIRTALDQLTEQLALRYAHKCQCVHP